MNQDEENALATIERALIDCPCTSDEAERATEWLGALRRRDWAVRVLDAWAALATDGVERKVQTENWGQHDRQPWCCDLQTRPEARTPLESVAECWAATPDAARLAAAQAVYTELPADARAELGECP